MTMLGVLPMLLSGCAYSSEAIRSRMVTGRYESTTRQVTWSDDGSKLIVIRRDAFYGPNPFALAIPLADEGVSADEIRCVLDELNLLSKEIVSRELSCKSSDQNRTNQSTAVSPSRARLEFASGDVDDSGLIVKDSTGAVIRRTSQEDWRVGVPAYPELWELERFYPCGHVKRRATDGSQDTPSNRQVYGCWVDKTGRWIVGRRNWEYILVDLDSEEAAFLASPVNRW